MDGPGDLFRQPTLAVTLRELADSGLTAYLHGAAGPALAGEMSEHGGLITATDLAGYRPRPAAPHAVAYRTHTILGPAHGGVYGLLFSTSST
jgi:gamma-glutamyltranspeptidase/glutathione hydrolase